MIVIYSKAQRKQVEDDVANRALEALQQAIERIEARGDCAALERARWEKLRVALTNTHCERLQ